MSGVGQAESEGIADRLLIGVKIPVSDVHSLSVIRVSLLGRIICGGRDVLIDHRVGLCQLTGRIDAASQKIEHGTCACLSGQISVQDRLEGILPLHLDGRACADHADHIGIDLGHRTQHIDLDLGNMHMCAVKSFRLAHLIEAEEIEDNVCAFCRLDGFTQERGIRFTASLIAVAHRRDCKILLFLDHVLDRLNLSGIDHGGACSLVSGQECEITDNSNFRARLQRQNAFLVFKQDRTVRGGLSGQRMVTLDIEFFAVSLGRFRRWASPGRNLP